MSPPPDDQRKKFTCEQCQEVFVSEEARQEHLESCFQCENCGQIFRKKYLVTTHTYGCMRANGEVTFTHRDSVDTDMTSHTSEEVSSGECGDHIEDNSNLPDNKQDSNKTDEYKRCAEAIDESGHIKPDLREQESPTTSESGKDLGNDNSLQINSRVDIANEYFTEEKVDSGNHIEDNSNIPDDKQDRNKTDKYKLCDEAVDESGHIEPDLREKESPTTSESGKDLGNDNSLRINSRVDIANENFTEDLTSDMMKQGSDAPFKCNVNNKHSLDEHVDLHTGEKPQCTTHDQLTNHMRRHSPKKLHTEEKLYECSDCGKCFKNKGCLKRHMKTHTGEKPHKCDICGKSFTLRDYLTRHMRIHIKKRAYQCSDCGKCFESNGNLTKHIRTHTGERPYKCDVCGKCFTENHHLIEHMRIHTGEKPYKCNDCGQCFRNNGTLTVHKRTHSDEMPYSCHVCGKCFKQRSGFTQHMKKHHGE